MAIWVAEAFRAEHLAVLDQLNGLAPGRLRLMAVQLSVWRIGDSRPAVRLECVRGWKPPSKAPRSLSVVVHTAPAPAASTGRSPAERKACAAFWRAFEVARVRAGLRFSGTVAGDKDLMGWGSAWPNVQYVVSLWPDALRVGLVAAKDSAQSPWTQAAVAARLPSLNAVVPATNALADRRRLTPRVPHFATERPWTLQCVDQTGRAEAAAWAVAALAALDRAVAGEAGKGA